MSIASPIQRILSYNEGRIPKMLQRKYAGMNENAFRFYRGTCHLFYEDLPIETPLSDCPTTWICGDLHLENFGSYKADNGLEYFDINDFDEAVLAPCLWDIARLLVSVILAADVSLHTNEASAYELCRSFIYNYTHILQKGHVGMVEQRTTKGLVKDFLRAVGKRKRQELINKRTVIKNGQRQLIVDEEKVSELETAKKEQIKFIIEKWAERHANNPKDKTFYEVLDVGYRIAGTGSLGLERYVLLVEGKGSVNGNFLLDLKVAETSAIMPHLKITQPTWKNEADRVTSVQRRMQIDSPALLTTIDLDGKSYTLKQLQPSQDKMDLSLCNGKLLKLDKVLTYFAQIIAYAQLRSSGRQGSAIVDELIDFSHQTHWVKPLMEYVISYSQKVQQDYRLFSEAYKDEQFFN
jgi:uncharacterized protein (DUF2252 family)